MVRRYPSMLKEYQRFAASTFVIGVLIAVAGPSLLDLISVQTWDVIFPPPSPKLTDSELLFVRTSVVHYLSSFPVIVGAGLALFAAFHWLRARRLESRTP